jgi:phosphoribosylaminoimidazole-succinocarboxamide synthase
MSAMAVSDLPLDRIARGKVRDVYAVDDDRLLLLMTETIPHKGAVLTQITAWWLRQLDGRIAHHLISADTDEILDAVPELRPHRSAVSARAMLCRRTRVFPIECVIRGYLAGSAWKEYRATGTLAGEPLPPGLRESERLDPAIFSPATKAESGHDENITIDRMRQEIGDEVTALLERLTRLVYEHARTVAEPRGIIVADTKFEFGMTAEGTVLLIDEVLTPDSSRFWPADGYAPGRPQPSFDKQPLRDYLDGERRAGRWTGDYPSPSLPDDVVRATSERYREAFRRITGSELPLPAGAEW